ncbi:MAG: hypothetical protein M3N32_06425, partial [Actinomycetota bacterium]|nr:hypothetical protein [Actinomycetota bacterium]
MVSVNSSAVPTIEPPLGGVRTRLVDLGLVVTQEDGRVRTALDGRRVASHLVAVAFEDLDLVPHHVRVT